MKLLPYTKKWKILFEEEKSVIKNAIENCTDIQHIGSTAIFGIMSKPIIDIAVMLTTLEEANNYIIPLSDIGYIHDQVSSSSERYFFRKGNPVKYHLSLTAPNVTFLKRQILFRDYLNSHPPVAKEYEKLKIKIIKEDPTGGENYINAKDSFVKRVLRLAER
jgi:GrpB-like predicted nucleotidyltransferase (UPF0157 family)